MRIYPRRDYLYIGVENALPEGIDKQKLLALGTTKPDASEHGLGPQIIKRLVTPYNGYLTYSIEGGQFIADAIMNLMESSANGGGGRLHA